MTKSGRKSPGVGRGENHASDTDILKALAVEILDKEHIEKVTEIRKRHRKQAEGNGIALPELDGLYKRRNDPVQDILADFRRQLHYFGAFFKPIRAQADLFMKSSESVEAQNAAMIAGRMAGLTGKPAEPPPNLIGEDQQIWLEAHGEAAKARAAAEKERRDEEKKAAEEQKASQAIDGTGKGGQAEKVRAQAAADFAKDNPGITEGDVVDVVKEVIQENLAAGDGIFDGDGTLPTTSTGYAGAGERYMLSTDETYPSGRRAAYVDGKPVGSSIPGKVPVYKDHPPAAAGDDGFEATAEELAAQQNRPSRQQGPEIDENEVEAQAKKLQENGFVPDKPKRGGRRLPGERTS